MIKAFVMSIIIGISGVSGSGKTTLTKDLGEVLNATTIFWDDYDDLSKGPSDYVQWYHTSRDCNDWEYNALEHTLKTLKEGQKTICPVTQKELLPTKFIIFDAPLGYEHLATGQYIDFLIFLDTPLDVALARRIVRDYQPESGKDKNQLLKELQYYLHSSRPVYLLSYQHKNDLLLDGSLPSKELLEVSLKSIGDKFKDPGITTEVVKFFPE